MDMSQGRESEQDQVDTEVPEKTEGAESLQEEARAEARTLDPETGKSAAGPGSNPAFVKASEYEELKDKNLRLFAEFENFRRRTARENLEVVANANAKLIGKLTEVLDNFALAFDPQRKAGKPEDFEKGVQLIYNKLRDILEEEGLEPLDPQGEDFDPQVHDALMQQPSDTVPEGKVLQVLQKGYKLKSKILKHAKVVVSTGKA